MKTSQNLTHPQFFKPVLLFCFFFSGICGLVYEVAWLRVLSVIFGNTTFATSAILSSYMAGLGLGALYFGRRIDRAKSHPIRFYAWLEGGVAIFAFFTPWIWKAIEWILVHFYRAFEPGFLTLNLFKFILVFVCLFIPTFLMGGTLPVVAKYFVRKNEETTRFVGFLYALNTLGAVLGVLFTGFIAIYTIGVWQTVFLAGAFNALIFFLFWNYKTDEISESGVSEEAPKAAPSDLSHSFVLLFLFACSGAVSMMYEVGWTRVLAMILGSSVYAFTSMLACFLLGISVGSYAFSLILKRIKVSLQTFAMLQFIIAGLVFWGINQFMDMSYAFLGIYKWANGNMTMMEVGKFLLCLRVMLPPTLVIGAIFPCFIEIFKKRKELGEQVGIAYFANTLGTIFGAAVAGFFILPSVGIQNTLFMGAAINVVIGLCAIFMIPDFYKKRNTVFSAGLLAVILLGASSVKPWNVKIIASDTAIKPEKLTELSKREFFDTFRSRELLFYREGHSSTVSVVKNNDNVSLAVNGKVDASIQDGFTQYFLGHLPMILHKNPKKVLVIGLGSASTVAAVASYPVNEVHAVELEHAVVEAAPFFKKINRDVLSDPKVRLFVNDGRNFLLLREDKYDVIVSEPSNPWIAGVANLFSREHFQTMRDRLNEGGVVCQWLHAYSMSTEDLSMIIKTFTIAFPHTQLWTSFFPDLMLIGFKDDHFSIPLEQVQHKFRDNPYITKDMAEYGVQTAESLFGSFWLGDAQLRDLSKNAKIHTDNLPLLEFSAPRNLYNKTLQPNYQFLAEARQYAYPFLTMTPSPENNLFFYHEIARALLAKNMFSDVLTALVQANKIEANHPRTLELDGLIQLGLNKNEEARAKLESLLDKNELSPDGLLGLGSIYLSENENQKAIQVYNKVLVLDQESVKARTGLANALFNIREYKHALALYEAILKSDGNNFNIMLKVVEIHLLMSKMPEKIQALERMAKTYPQHGPVYLQLAQIYEQIGKFDLAAREYQKFIDLAPDEVIALIGLARVYEKSGDRKKMIKVLKAAIKLNPELSENPQIKALFQK